MYRKYLASIYCPVIIYFIYIVSTSTVGNTFPADTGNYIDREISTFPLLSHPKLTPSLIRQKAEIRLWYWSLSGNSRLERRYFLLQSGNRSVTRVLSFWSGLYQVFTAPLPFRGFPFYFSPSTSVLLLLYAHNGSVRCENNIISIASDGN